jgi:hypothetical protein
MLQLKITDNLCWIMWTLLGLETVYGRTYYCELFLKSLLSVEGGEVINE